MPSWITNSINPIGNLVKGDFKSVIDPLNIKKSGGATTAADSLDIPSLLNSIYGPEATNLQLGNLNQMLGGNFNADAFGAANPGLMADYQRMMASGELDKGWTPEMFAKANGLDPAQYSTGGLLDLSSRASAQATQDQTAANSALRSSNVADLSRLGPEARAAWQSANPELAKFTSGMLGTMDRLNAQAAPRVNANGAANGALGGPATAATRDAAGFTAGFTGADAAQAGFAGAQASRAGYQGANAYQASGSRASGGPLLGRMTADASANLGQVTPIQLELQRQAMEQLGTAGNLTAQDLYSIQQDTRGAYAARGLYDNNSAIGAEILNTDAARRSRMLQNQANAQAIDASGQQQIAANRGYALNTQNQGQTLSTFNTGQQNALSQYNAGLLNNASQFNAGQKNAQSQFNAGLLTDTSKYNAGQANAQGQFNAGLLSNSSQFNASQANSQSQFNAGMLNNLAQFNAGATNTANLANAAAANNFSLTRYGTEADNARFNSSQDLQAQLANANFTSQNTSDQWARAMQYAGLLGGQASEINNLAIGGTSNSPQLGQGSVSQGQAGQNSLTDLLSGMYNFNANANNAAGISAGNNSAATNSAAIGAVGAIGGAALVVF